MILTKPFGGHGRASGERLLAPAEALPLADSFQTRRVSR